MAKTEGRVGDWNCKECGNLNYAFRPACNRCKHPKVHIPPHGGKQPKWRPRPGDWICRGCNNNNYSFRENCNKCGEPKDVFQLPTNLMRAAMMDEMAHPLKPGMDHPWENSGNGYLTGGLSLGGNSESRDWRCGCGFLNYSLDARCKQCQMPPLGSSSHVMPLSMVSKGPYSGYGSKRIATNEVVDDWMRKRQHVGDFNPTQHMLPPGIAYEAWPHANHSSIIPRNLDASLSRTRGPISEYDQLALSGNGLKHWREGDWICSSCENHNYASREFCNRCKGQKDATGNLGSAY